MLVVTEENKLQGADHVTVELSRSEAQLIALALNTPINKLKEWHVQMENSINWDYPNKDTYGVWSEFREVANDMSKEVQE